MHPSFRLFGCDSPDSFFCEGSFAGDGDVRSAATAPAGLDSTKTSVFDKSDTLTFDSKIAGKSIDISPGALAVRRIKRLRKNIFASGRLLDLSLKSSGHRCWLVTLTYRGIDDWSPRHISDCIGAFRRWCKKRGIKPRYTWVAELQTRGAIHYHLALWLPGKFSCPMFDRGGRDYQRFWPHGHTNRINLRFPTGYLLKYMSKLDSKHHKFPRGARIHGSGGLNPEDRQIKTWLNFPIWLKQISAVGEVVTKLGRRIVKATGEVLQSPYKVLVHPHGLTLHTVGDVPDVWVSGPWSRYDASFGCPF